MSDLAEWCDFIENEGFDATLVRAAIVEIEQWKDRLASAPAEYDRLRHENAKLRKLAHDAENIIGELVDDEHDHDLVEWRQQYRELGLL